MLTEARSRKTGSLISLETNEDKNLFVTLGGKYQEATKAGRIFVVSNQAAVTTTAALALTYTGLAVCNPVGSGKNLAMLGYGFAQTVAVPTTASTVGLMTGSGISAATKVITARNRLTGGPASVANCDDAVVFTEAPVLEQVFCIFAPGALTVAVTPPIDWIDLNGSLIVTPGYHVSAYNLAVNASCFIFSFLWEEYTP